MTTAAQIKERPILFSSPMVQAILEGRKTMTRRIVKPQPTEYNGFWSWRKNYNAGIGGCNGDTSKFVQLLAGWSPYGQPGDRLWVREAMYADKDGGWTYKADDEPVGCDRADETQMIAWVHHKQTEHCSSIHMPRWASRITLEITDVRVERLQDISDSDAVNEGITGVLDDGIWSYNGHALPRDGFTDLWKKINGDGSWDANPWVWVVSFKVVQ